MSTLREEIDEARGMTSGGIARFVIHDARRFKLSPEKLGFILVMCERLGYVEETMQRHIDAILQEAEHGRPQPQP